MFNSFLFLEFSNLEATTTNTGNTGNVKDKEATEEDDYNSIEEEEEEDDYEIILDSSKTLSNSQGATATILNDTNK